MANISGLEVKKEITKAYPRGAECKSMLSGFVRSCMSLSLTKSGVLLQLDCQTDFVRDYIATAMRNMLNVTPKESKPMLVYDNAESLLAGLNITAAGGGYEMTGIPQMTDENESAYVRGVFLGCGSFSAHYSDGTDGQKGGGGYHLEFSVLSESFADEIMELLKSREVLVRKMERADKYVVYAKDIENVSNCLALMRLGKQVVKLNDTAIALSIKRDVNRRMNCDIANMTRTANAAVDVINAIQYISDCVGLDSLPPKLVEAADARLNAPEASLYDIAFELNISKSGLKHRFDRIIQIAQQLQKNKKG
ncbi:MAG: DNA-binding protein WhiA [Clostridiales bacterium]|nr:DNA-binding protein WhiA [Clostridiales bacterium]